MQRAQLAVFACVLVFCAGGCSPPCSTDNGDPVTFDQGAVSADGTGWESSPWNGPYLHFPPGRRYRLEHQLGKIPLAVHTYLSFDEYPMPKGNAAESAGNQAVIERVDDSVIVVRNDTCAEFWLRVVAMGAVGVQLSDAGSD